MKKHFLWFVCAFVVFSATPAMAGKKLSFRVYNQHTGYTIYWKRTQCDCVYRCDQLPGGTIRPHDMWPPGDKSSAQIESKDSTSGGDYCASQPSDLTLMISTDPSFPKDNTGIVSVRKYSSQFGKHWHKYSGYPAPRTYQCIDAKDIQVFCNLYEGDNDSIDIILELAGK